MEGGTRRYPVELPGGQQQHGGLSWFEAMRAVSACSQQIHAALLRAVTKARNFCPLELLGLYSPCRMEISLIPVIAREPIKLLRASDLISEWTRTPLKSAPKASSIEVRRLSGRASPCPFASIRLKHTRIAYQDGMALKGAMNDCPIRAVYDGSFVPERP